MAYEATVRKIYRSLTERKSGREFQVTVDRASPLKSLFYNYNVDPAFINISENKNDVIELKIVSLGFSQVVDFHDVFNAFKDSRLNNLVRPCTIREVIFLERRFSSFADKWLLIALGSYWEDEKRHRGYFPYLESGVNVKVSCFATWWFYKFDTRSRFMVVLL